MDAAATGAAISGRGLEGRGFNAINYSGREVCDRGYGY